ncbi:hypothetical protein JMJ77_0006817 [Colletotrichum scovillei]|uniref:Uncharacterized protein n=1 Tax=Colletotrichum scovillei TaxID=1209932 RepID=A0A9P7UIK8_9PEZI|nr:hypothetical protein JMJ77_0006817 [Colletotrichum scovillei]KAG7078063.1 hypothetical protein JMJ76_0015299 [Colletotrichum scovillei]KAG7085094.1 hypothetical protein JMJ78_0010521 [Colletotrichum scovillei]
MIWDARRRTKEECPKDHATVRQTGLCLSVV